MKLNFLGAACDWLTTVEATTNSGGGQGHSAGKYTDSAHLKSSVNLHCSSIMMMTLKDGFTEMLEPQSSN